MRPFATLAPSAARTVSAGGDALDLSAILDHFGWSPQLRVQLDVTAVSGTTPSLTLVVEDSVDGGVNWNTILTFSAATAVGRQVSNAAWPFNAGRVRARWVVSGTVPSFTFSVKALLV